MVFFSYVKLERLHQFGFATLLCLVTFIYFYCFYNFRENTSLCDGFSVYSLEHQSSVRVVCIILEMQLFWKCLRLEDPNRSLRCLLSKFFF